MTRSEIIAALSEPHDSDEHVRLMGLLDATDREAGLHRGRVEIVKADVDPAAAMKAACSAPRQFTPRK